MYPLHITLFVQVLHMVYAQINRLELEKCGVKCRHRHSTYEPLFLLATSNARQPAIFSEGVQRFFEDPQHHLDAM